MGKQLTHPALSVFALLISILSPISLTHATAAPALVTCVNLQTGTERISHTGKCRYTQEAQANWHKNPSDSPIASGASAKVITICSNKESSPVSYQVIRKKCARHQVTTVFSRSGALPAKPVITEAVSFGHDSASLKLATDPAASADAPIAFYTVTSTTIDTRTPIIAQSQKVYYWKDLSIAVSTLQSSTRYTFTVSATTADGTSPVSIASIPVTTLTYVPPASATSAGSVAAPAFTLSSTTETKIVNSAITGYTISSSGGAITSYSISPSPSAGLTFNTSTGLLSGTPTSVQSATTYTLTGTNAGGSSTATFTLAVSGSAPSFVLSSNSETRVATTSVVGYTIDASAGATIASYSLVGTLPAGLSFSTATGRITGTPSETKTATTYTIIGASASGETATATYRLRVTGDIGDFGPGGGKIFHYSAGGFACGQTRTATCKYLEVAPNGWNGGADSTVTWAQSPYSSNTPGYYLNLSTSIGYGFQNTKAIIDQGNTNVASSAAAFARSYSATVEGVSFDDWFLPAEEELLSLYTQRVAVGIQFSSGSGIHYWSSSSSNNANGKYVHVATSFVGTASGALKTTAYYVRPIRSF